MSTYRTVLNVPDRDWARGVIDRSIADGIIIVDDPVVDDWANLDMTDGRFWTFLDRARNPTTPPVEPPVEPPGDVLWSHDFEDGTYDELRPVPNNVTSSKVVDNPAGNGKVLELMSDTSNGKNAGNRMVFDERNRFGPDPKNLPDVATYSGWFNLQDNQSGGCNIFQFKQRMRGALIPGFSGNNYDTHSAMHLYNITVQHATNGNHKFGVALRLTPDGQWATPAGERLTVSEFHWAPGAPVKKGQWHHLEWDHKFSGDPDGYVRVRLDGEEIVNLTGRVTELPYHQSEPEPVGFDWINTADTTWVYGPRQVSWCNYMYTGTNSPSRTVVLWDDVKIAA